MTGDDVSAVSTVVHDIRLVWPTHMSPHARVIQSDSTRYHSTARLSGIVLFGDLAVMDGRGRSTSPTSLVSGRNRESVLRALSHGLRPRYMVWLFVFTGFSATPPWTAVT